MNGKIYQFEDYVLDVSEQRLQKDGKDISLPPKVFEVLTALMKRPGELITYQELMEEVWQDTFVEETNLRYSIHALRKTFPEDFIETVPKRGYRFKPKVKSFTKEEFIKLHTGNFKKDELMELVDKPAEKPESSFKKYAAIVLITCLMAGFGSAAYYFFSGSKDSIQSVNKKLKYDRLSASGRAYHSGLSPNNQHVAYSIYTPDGKYSLILHHLVTGSETVILEPQEYSVASIQFSPDGNYIYYLGLHGTKHRGVFRIPIFGGQPQMITQEPVDYVNISPDGEWLAYYRREAKVGHFLEICRSRDGSERRVVTKRLGSDIFSIWGVAPAWSPDGKKLVSSAFSRQGENQEQKNFLIEIDVATGEQTQLKSPEWYRVYESWWQADGKGLFVLVREKKGDFVQIWELEYPNGKARNITNDSNDYRHFRPSADGSFLTATTWVRTENLFLIPLENPANIRQLTFDTASVNGSSGLKWTTDGKEILFTKGKTAEVGNLFKINPETLETSQITNDPNLSPNYVEVTPDGKSAVFASKRTGFWNLWQIDLDGRNLRQITKGKNEQAPEISPDGKWLYYIGDGLWKMPLAGGEAVRIWDETPGTTRISPTNPNQLISYFHDKNEKGKNPWMFVLYSEDNPRGFRNLDINAVIQFEWKPDGSGIYYADSGEAFNNLRFISIKDFKNQKITDFNDQRIANMSLSPDGKMLAVSRGSQIGNVVKISGFR